jgi:hypothetical protein
LREGEDREAWPASPAASTKLLSKREKERRRGQGERRDEREEKKNGKTLLVATLKNRNRLENAKLAAPHMNQLG